MLTYTEITPKKTNVGQKSVAAKLKPQVIILT